MIKYKIILVTNMGLSIASSFSYILASDERWFSRLFLATICFCTFVIVQTIEKGK